MFNKIIYCFALAASVALFHGNRLEAQTRTLPPGRITIDHGDNPNVGGLDRKFEKGSGSSNPNGSTNGVESPPGGSIGQQ